MLLRQENNILGVFHIDKDPVFRQNIGKSKNVTLTKVSASCRFFGKDLEGETPSRFREPVAVELLFFDELAIPANETLSFGSNIVVLGYVDTRSYYNQQYKQTRIPVVAEFWFPCTNDPFRILTAINARSEMLVNGILGKLIALADEDDTREDNVNERTDEQR